MHGRSVRLNLHKREVRKEEEQTMVCQVCLQYMQTCQDGGLALVFGLHAMQDCNTRGVDLYQMKEALHVNSSQRLPPTNFQWPEAVASGRLPVSQRKTKISCRKGSIVFRVPSQGKVDPRNVTLLVMRNTPQ